MYRIDVVNEGKTEADELELPRDHAAARRRESAVRKKITSLKRIIIERWIACSRRPAFLLYQMIFVQFKCVVFFHQAPCHFFRDVPCLAVPRQVSGEGTEEKYLIATSEQPMCAFHKGEWLNESELPLR